MAKNKNHKEEEQLEVVGDVVENAESFFQKHKNILFYGIAAIVVVVGGYFGYTELISKPHQREASAQMFRAEAYFAVDSFQLALNGDGNALGFNQITSEYGGTEAGNLAHFYAGICQYQLADYNSAIAELKKFSAKDELIAARALCVIGDSYVELNQLDEAIKYFTQAANHNNNSFAAGYLMKAAHVYEAQSPANYKNALALYEKIQKDYPQSTEAREIDKYIERATIMMNNNK